MPDWRTWPRTAWTSRWSRRRRSSFRTAGTPPPAYASPGSSTTSRWRSAPRRRTGCCPLPRCRCRTPTRLAGRRNAATRPGTPAWRSGTISATATSTPSAYRHRFSVDSVVFAPAALRLLVDTLGPDRVMVGSDYPYPLGERPAGAVVRDAAFLDDAAREAILFRNAVRFLSAARVRQHVELG